MRDTGLNDRPGSQGALRRANRDRILAELASGRAPSQAELARETGLSPATVSNIVRGLERDGLVMVVEIHGRRGVALRSAGGALAASIDYGHRHVTVAVAGADGSITGRRRAELSPDVPAADGLRLAAQLLSTVLTDANTTLDALVGIGMGLPAPIDSRTGCVGSPTILPGWVGERAAQLATQAFGRPVVVDNDANLGALAEHRWGRGVGLDNLAYLKLSEGVGAGLIIDGRIYRGPAGTAGEIGHTVIDEFGALCRCGNRGCLESMVAARRVTDELRPVVGRELTINEVVARAGQGDRTCARVIADTGLQVGRAVADLCNLTNPELVVIGGELAQAGELLLAPIRQVIARRGIPSAVDELQLATAALGDRTHVLGGIARAFDAVAAG